MPVEGEPPIRVERVTFIEVGTTVMRDTFEGRHVVVCDPGTLLKDGFVGAVVIPRSTETKHISLGANMEGGKVGSKQGVKRTSKLRHKSEHSSKLTALARSAERPSAS